LILLKHTIGEILLLAHPFKIRDDSCFADEDGNKPIDRGGEAVPVAFQLEVYVQAVLIFLGKATIYLKAMDKSLPQSFQEYIG
jgi:hypothetical protein